MSKDAFSSPRWQRLRLKILERDGYRCQVRGPKCTAKATQADHIIPVADGGSMWDPENLRAACQWCNTWRAQRQKNREGWRRADTHIVLVMGPPAAGKSTYVQEHAGPADVVVDYDAISRALGPLPEQGHGGVRHDMVMQVRGRLLTQLRRGDLPARRAWIVTCDPRAEAIYPHHAVVVLDPGKDEVLRRARADRPEHLLPVIEDWYHKRAAQAAPVGMREW